jgi:hypothetical protein
MWSAAALPLFFPTLTNQKNSSFQAALSIAECARSE